MAKLGSQTNVFRSTMEESHTWFRDHCVHKPSNSAVPWKNLMPGLGIIVSQR